MQSKLSGLITRRYVLVTLLFALVVLITTGNVSAGVPSSRLPASPPSNSQQGTSGLSVPFDCSQIERFGIDKQMNLRAAQILANCRGTKLPQSASTQPGNVTAPFKSLLPN